MLTPRENCAYDLISLGEVMLRFDPGEGRVRTARSFAVWEGGGEYNVARGLRRCFNLKTAVATAFAENDVGRLLEDLILQGGVDTSFIQWIPFDGIGRMARNGLNFVERGFGARGALSVSDRANTAASRIKPGDFDWDYIFGTLGVRWLHTGGIFTALSPSTAEAAVEAVRAAKRYDVIVSYDINYRASLWRDIGGKTKAQTVNKAIAPHVDVMLGNEEDFTACLGLEVEGNDANLRTLDADGYSRMLEQAAREYPNFRVIASTLRTVHTATVNDWAAIAWADGRIIRGMKLDKLEVLDRIGGGDSFASGLIYGLMTGADIETALQYGVAHGALAMTTPGDTSMASKREVEALMRGGNARVKR